jgi:hypothetical protein
MAVAIQALLPLAQDDADFLRELSDLRLSNWNGLEVGRLTAAAPLRALVR